MNNLISKLIFKRRGYIPYSYYLSWPVNPDDEYLRVFVQWGEDDEVVMYPLKITLEPPE